MIDVSDRHQGDLEGQLAPWERRRPLRVRLIVGDGAGESAVQHTAWMLVNLLSRMDGIVSAIELECPSVPLLDRVIPEVAATDLADGLAAGATAIDVVQIEPTSSTADVVFELGPGPQPDVGYRVHGDGWAGAIAAAALPGGRGSGLPFGPYLAACLAAGRVFLLSRAPEIAAEEDYSVPLVWSAWSLQLGGAELFADGPDTIEAVIDAGLAGIGAVGAAAAHALWATEGAAGSVLAVDADKKGVDLTNLNRGVAFIKASIGAMKALEAARRLGDGEIQFDPRHGRYQDQPTRPGLLLSAVDTNRARTDLQNQYPARIIGASTYGLRAELVRCGPPGRGPCLRCDNPPEPQIDDEQVRERLRQASPAEVKKIAVKAGVSVNDAMRWALTPKCGTVDTRMLSTMAAEVAEDEDGGAQFAVAFVSVFAGTQLAAEAIKETIGAPVPLHDGANRVVFQFFRPRAASNQVGFVGRDRGCPACTPGAGLAIWEKRHRDWGPARPEPKPSRSTPTGSARPRSRFRPAEADSRVESGSGRETRTDARQR